MKLTVTAEDEKTTRDYTIKVNVHTQEPDSLVWDKLAVTPLPSLQGKPTAQKTVQFKSTTYTLLQEKDDSYTLAVADDVLAGKWTRHTPGFGFGPMCARLQHADRIFSCSTHRVCFIHRPMV